MRRLAYVCTAAVVLSVVGYGLSFLRQPNVGALREGIERPAVILPLFTALSVLVLLVARNPRLAARRRLDVGLVYLVVACAFGSLFRHWLPYDPADVMRGIPPSAFAILFFAVVVPVRPGRMTVAAVAAAAVDPLALWGTSLLGNAMPPANLWLWLVSPLALAVPLAVATSRVLFKVGRSLDEARELGSYRLVELLGEGGMGQVWRAEHRLLARPVAIKRIAPGRVGNSADPHAAAKMMARFAREARATAQLESPHTIEIFDFGTDESGAFFYVMELLEGMDLQSLVSHSGPLPPARVIELLRQVCESLADAHERGLIHRDIKPANLFVCRRGSQWDFVKVLDFGLVKLEEADAAVSLDEGIMGSPGYIAPEILRGANATRASDIYAFGCVAFWLLAARTVFEGDTLGKQIQAHCSLAPTPPSVVLGAAIPVALDELVLRCLAKLPHQRPEGFDTIQSQLHTIDGIEPWTHAAAKRWWLEHAPRRASVLPAARSGTPTKTWVAADQPTRPAD